MTATATTAGLHDGRTIAGVPVRLAIAAAGVFTVLAALSTDDGVVLCPFRRCTGGYCPGCGLTRSGGRLLRGDLAGSWQLHPYLLFAVIQLAAIGTVWRFGSGSIRRRLQSITQPVLLANLALITAIWVVRLVGGGIPLPFSG